MQAKANIESASSTAQPVSTPAQTPKSTPTPTSTSTPTLTSNEPTPKEKANSLKERNNFKKSFEKLLKKSPFYSHHETEVIQLIKTGMHHGIFQETYTISAINKNKEYLYFVLLQHDNDAFANICNDYILSPYYDPKTAPLSLSTNSTYLHLAVTKTNTTKLVQSIVARKNYNARHLNNQGTSAVTHTLTTGNSDLLLKLLESDISIVEDETVLKMAIRQQMVPVIRKLVPMNMCCGIFNNTYKYQHMYDCGTPSTKEDYLFFVLLHYKIFDTAEQYVTSRFYNLNSPTISKQDSSPKTETTQNISHTQVSQISKISMFTHLIAALSAKSEKLAALILAREDRNINTEHVSLTNTTALITACANNYESIALKLLDRPCSFQMQNFEGKTALSYALANKMDATICKLVRTYLQLPLSTFRQCNIFGINHRVNYSIVIDGTRTLITDGYLFHTLLMLKLIDPLIEYIESKHFTTEQVFPQLSDGNCYLIDAIRYGEKVVVQKLLASKKCTVNVNTMKKDGHTALTLACYRNVIDVALKILDTECNIHAVTNSGESALTYSLKNKMYDAFWKIMHIIRGHYRDSLLDDATYNAYIFTVLDIMSKAGDEKNLITVLSTFPCDKGCVLKIYNKSTVEIGRLIMRFFDLSDVGFLVAKYGPEKLQFQLVAPKS